MLTKEQLLTPRVRVKGYYPHSKFEIGEILTLQNWKPEKPNHVSRYGVDKHRTESKNNVEKSPLIFEMLKWWRYRDINDMPEYVAFYDNSAFMKVYQYNLDRNQVQVFGVNSCLWITDMLPATEQEYLEYLNGKK